MTEITKQNYPCLCLACIRNDGRTDLEEQRIKGELIKYSKGMKCLVAKKDIEKYSMTWNETLFLYVCDKHAELKRFNGESTVYTIPDIPIPLFWATCSKCGKKNVNTLSQEKFYVKRTFDRKLVEEPIKELKTILVKEEILPTEDQEETVCKHCNHKGKKINEDKF